MPGDEGVVLIRRGLREQLRRITAGEDPAGVSFDENAPPVILAGGRTLGPVPTASAL